MFKSIKFKVVLIASIFSVLVFVNNVSATQINTNANVLSELTVTTNNDLDFGSFSTIGADTILFPANGGISSGGNVTLLGGESIGLVTITSNAAPNASLVTVILSTITTLTCFACGGTPMTLVPDCEIVGGGGTQSLNECTFSSTATIDDQVQIGGSLSVNAVQNIGVYSGSIEVTAGYN